MPAACRCLKVCPLRKCPNTVNLCDLLNTDKSLHLPRAAGARTFARRGGLDAALPPHLVERERERADVAAGIGISLCDVAYL